MLNFGAKIWRDFGADSGGILARILAGFWRGFWRDSGADSGGDFGMILASGFGLSFHTF